MVPITAIARQARGLDAKYRTGGPAADCGHEPLKARSLNEAGARAPQIVIDGGNRGKSHGACRLGQSVLATLTLGVLEHLPRGRLTNVYDGTAREVLRGDLRVHRPLLIRLGVC